ncbi:MAG: transketolase family protein, partial [Candidatus Methanomethylophilaceae archaeon]|nr:transketolase family protein [Candidatus Methanomethylophilaceae archaeon]
KTREDVVVLDADLASSTKTSDFLDAAPDRFVEVGIAEQNMIGVSAGLAASGKTVFASTFAVFATGRCWEQIRLSVAYPKLNVKIVATHCGISVGADGTSHQALEDISLMRSLPNMTVVSPADAYETYDATLAISEKDGPFYMRMGRSDVPTIMPEDTGFRIGKASVLVDGKDVSLVGTGQMVHACLEAAKILRKEGISAEVVNMSTIKPLDTATLGKTISRTGCIVTAEEHSIIGGLGSAVAEYISEEGFVPLTRIGTRDTFGESGTPEELFKKYGLTAEDVASAARKSMAKRRRS